MREVVDKGWAFIKKKRVERIMYRNSGEKKVWGGILFYAEEKRKEKGNSKHSFCKTGRKKEKGGDGLRYIQAKSGLGV